MNVQLATIESLFSQPLKSGASQSVTEQVLTAQGALEGDRDYVLVEDLTNGQFNGTSDLVFPFISARKDPFVALIDVELDGDETWFSSRAPWPTPAPTTHTTRGNPSWPSAPSMRRPWRRAA